MQARLSELVIGHVALHVNTVLDRLGMKGQDRESQYQSSYRKGLWDLTEAGVTGNPN
jgi:hypothetical protein